MVARCMMKGLEALKASPRQWLAAGQGELALAWPPGLRSASELVRMAGTGDYSIADLAEVFSIPA